MRLFTPCLLVAALVSGIPQYHALTIPEQVRREGNVEILMNYQHEPASLKDLVQKSGLIAHVIIRAERSHLTSDQTSIVTDYDAEMIQVVHSKISAPLKSRITVMKRGGTLAVEGHTIKAGEPGFAPFLVGVEYLLCLVQSKEGLFETVYGGQGAFEIDGSSATQMTRHLDLWGTEGAELKSVTVDRLLRGIQEAIVSSAPK